MHCSLDQRDQFHQIHLHLAQRAYPMRLAEAIGWKPAWDMREWGGAIQICRLLWRRLCLGDIHLCSEILRKLSLLVDVAKFLWA